MTEKKNPVPIVASIKFPLAMESSRLLCFAAMNEAQAAMDSCKAQLACLCVESFFAKHPNIASVSFRGDWDSDDQGGSHFSLTGSGDFLEGTNEDGEEDEDEVCWDFASELSDWAENLDGETLTAKNARREFGKLAMGAGEYDLWVAACEKHEIEGVAKASEKRKPTALRV